MITLKTPAELTIMPDGGASLREVMDLLEAEVKPGVATRDLDRFAREELQKRGTRPAFLRACRGG